MKLLSWRIIVPPLRRLVLIVLVALVGNPAAVLGQADNVILVTMDGLRWQEVFGGLDQRLVGAEGGAVRDVEALRMRFDAEDATLRRRRLMPFLWSVVAEQGQLLGDPQHDSSARVSNGRYFSYPGYNELLCGFGDPQIDSNAKKPNRNVNVLEWLARDEQFAGRVAAFASWDVFPFILNQERSRLFVNAGWQPLPVWPDEPALNTANHIAEELPKVWSAVRYDVFTANGALAYLRHSQPRVLYVALGETDDWAHEGRYDLYLDAAYRCDQYVQRLWSAVEEMPGYAGKTALLITTDHGRGDTREGWKSHGVDYPGSDSIWVAALGAGVKPLGIRRNVHVTQAQIGATVARLVGRDFTTADPRIAPPLPLDRRMKDEG